MKKIYVNPQWQGGADLSTYAGAEEIKEYLVGQDFVTLPVSTDEAEMAVMKNSIKGFDALRRQMHSAYNHLRADAPDKIFIFWRRMRCRCSGYRIPLRKISRGSERDLAGRTW